MATVWKFETARFCVTLSFEPEEMDPADSFEFQEDIDAIRNGDVLWFCAVLRVFCGGNEVARDVLGGCAYRSIDEFIAAHRDPDPMNRNSSIMRASRGDRTVISHYFPDMVRQAVADARRTVCNMPQLRCA